MVASVVGFYTLPLFRRIRPKLHETPMTSVIGNCVVILILSSALPVLSRALGLNKSNILQSIVAVVHIKFRCIVYYKLLYLCMLIR